MLDDLGSFVKSHITDGHEVIVMINANSPGDDDSIEHCLPNQHPCTYQCGHLKINHIWGMAEVLTATVNASVLPFGAGPNLDHAILYIDFSFDTLTGLSSQTLHSPTHPGF